MTTRSTHFLCCAGASLALTACGGGTSTIGGTLSGLSANARIVLQNKGADNLTLSSNGSFAFPTSLSAGDTYSVTIMTQPVGQACTVASPTGTVNTAGDSVTSVAVTCVANASLGGTVLGLPAGTSVTLSNDGVLLPVAASGAFAFPGLITAGKAYNVTVSVQPAGHNCTVTNASGTIVANIMATVAVTCI